MAGTPPSGYAVVGVSVCKLCIAVKMFEGGPRSRRYGKYVTNQSGFYVVEFWTFTGWSGADEVLRFAAGRRSAARGRGVALNADDAGEIIADRTGLEPIEAILRAIDEASVRLITAGLLDGPLPDNALAVGFLVRGGDGRNLFSTVVWAFFLIAAAARNGGEGHWCKGEEGEEAEHLPTV